MPPPLENLRVLDLTRILAGPYCTMVLGDLGAEVIKVERPGNGDDTRQWGPPFAGGESAYFLCCNRNKKSITINLKSPNGQELIRRVAKVSHVVVENFLPGTLEKIGLDYDAMRKLSPRLVYCSISGFGQDGPNRDRPGYDALIQAMAGVMSITGERDGEPMKVGGAIADIPAGLYASNAILSALLAAERTGEGRHIDISLFDSTVSWLANVGSNFLISGEVPKRYGNQHPSIVPYQAFQTADDYIVVAIGNNEQWRRFCGVVGHQDVADDERFATNPGRVEHREVLIPMLEKIMKERSASEWIEQFEDAEVPAGPVNTLDRVFADPQIAAREMLLEVPHPKIGMLKMAGTPIKMTGMEERSTLAPPQLGEHTDEILTSVLDMKEGEIHRLRENGDI